MAGTDHITQLRKGIIDLAILALLQQHPRYGGEIVSILSDMSGLNATGGTVYPLLSRLKTQELVSTTWEESPHGPPRKYYHLTSAGRTTLRELTRNWNAIAAAMTTILEGDSR